MGLIIRHFDCHGDFISLHAGMFWIAVDDDHDTIIGINMGFEEVQLLVSGRFRAKLLEVLYKYEF